MKIQFISDLHVEMMGNRDIISNLVPVCDTLVVAGDIGLFNGYELNFLKSELFSKWKTVICVPGNHDFYHMPSSKYNKMKYTYQYERLKNLDCTRTEFYYINNDIVDIGDVRFVCSTLWTAINFHPLEIMKEILDYDEIGGFTTDKSNELNKLSIAFLTDVMENYDSSKKYVIVTHHVPLEMFTPKKFTNNISSVFNEAFSNNLYSFIEKYADKISVWNFGHTHTCFRKEILGCKFVCNPLGYVHGNENTICDQGSRLKFNSRLFYTV